MAKNKNIQKAERESLNIKDKLLEALKASTPEVFAEGKVNWDKVRLALGEHLDASSEKFNFTWAGKAGAVTNVLIPSKATLRPAEKESVKFDKSENLFIEGDNLEVLKLLQKSYFEQVKMIYIDPPYNTGNDFVYKDDFRQPLKNYLEQSGQVDSEGNRLSTNTQASGRFHSDWLTMMYPRLKLAWNLLRHDGVIFVSIDDNEVHHLRMLMDEIFGEENFVGILSVENNPKGRKNSEFISVSSEYLIIFAKDKQKSHFIENVPKKASDMTEDESRNFVHSSGKRVLVGENSFNKPVANPNSDKNYSVYYRQAGKSLLLIKEEFTLVNQRLLSEGYVKYYSYNAGHLVENTYTENKFRELFEKGALEFSQDKIYEKNFSDTIRIKSQLVNREFEAIVRGRKQSYSMELTTTGAGTYLKNLFQMNESPFPAPKNVGYLKLLISLFESEPFTVLDFFSGSSTTADAVMQLNSEDGGNRKFIMVQMPEFIDPKSEAYKAGYKTIADIGKERIRRVLKGYGDHKAIDGGFKVFKLGKSNYYDNLFEYDPDKSAEENDKAFKDYLNKAQKELFPAKINELDIVYENIIKEGLSLNAKIEEVKIGKSTAYKVSDTERELYISLDEKLSASAIEVLTDKEYKEKIFICFDGALGDSDKANLALNVTLKTI